MLECTFLSSTLKNYLFVLFFVFVSTSLALSLFLSLSLCHALWYSSPVHSVLIFTLLFSVQSGVWNVYCHQMDWCAHKVLTCFSCHFSLSVCIFISFWWWYINSYNSESLRSLLTAPFCCILFPPSFFSILFESTWDLL